MSDGKTPDTLHLPSFEEKVLTQLENVNLRLLAIEKKQAEYDYDTKPIWTRVLKEFSEMRHEVNAYFTNFDRKLDVINKEMLQIKADQKGIENRMDRIESQYPQIIVQDRQF